MTTLPIESQKTAQIRFTLNREETDVSFAPYKTLLEVLREEEDGNLHPLQDAFADLGAAQCGYCTPAILVTAKALLDQNPHPSRDQIREAISGNLCRCTGYLQIFEAVEAAMLKIADNKKSVTQIPR